MSDLPISNSLQVNLARQLVSQTRALPFVVPLTSAVFSAYLLLYANWSPVLAGLWYSAVMMLSIGRWFVLKRFDAEPPETEEQADTWLRILTRLEFVSGIIVGGICLLLPPMGFDQSLIPILLIVGQVTTAVPPLSSSRPAFLALSVNALGLCALWLALRGDLQSWLLCGLLLSTFGLLYSTFCSVHAALVRSFEVQIAHQKLSQQLLDTNAELEQQRQRTEQANRVQQRFLANMSQELRAPMNGLLGALSVLGRQKMVREQEMLTGIAYQTGKSMMALLNEILDLSRQDSTVLQSKTVGFDPRAMFEEVMGLLTSSAQLKELRLVLQLPADFPLSLRGDLTRTRQILLNLTGNALKFTTTGSVVLRAEVDAGHLLAEVTDTGPGLSKQQQHQLTESELINADLHPAQGLKVCRELCSLLGGEFGVRSSVGVGSTFWVKLPVEVLEAARSKEPQHDPVILVTDHTGVRDMLTAQLAALGYPVSVLDTPEPLQMLLQKSHTRSRVLLDMDLSSATASNQYQRLQQVADQSGHLLVAVSSLGALKLAETRHNLMLPARLSALDKALSDAFAPADESNQLTRTQTSREQEADEVLPERSRVLVIEDGDINRMLLKRMLQELSWQVDLAGNVTDAALYSKQQAYRLIVVDDALLVGQGEGEDADPLACLRGCNSEAKLLVVSNPVDLQQAQALRDRGADGLLSRPITLEHLEDTLSDLVLGVRAIS